MTSAAPSSSALDAIRVLQVVLDDPRLSGYYHFDVRPGRLPLKVANRTPTAFDVSLLRVGGQAARPVEQVDRETMSIESLAITGNEAEVHLSFKAEGIAARATLLQQDGSWSIRHMSVAER